MKKQKIFIDCQPLKTSCLYLINYSLDDLDKFITATKQDIGFERDYFKNADGITLLFNGIIKEGTIRVVWLKHFSRKDNYDIATLVHETIHMVTRMLEQKGIPYDCYRSADESLAYYVDFFVESVLNKLK